ncbi:uncharacterized protein ARMOST_10066 [Armillaria ostoyae]|uniref:Uncharacterized protein n=1 Tax=Armillaria ostoyae TaxID=47428 RepID=A0A284RD89_ARMOS|nr:uncharacterized protein ARMOST_10066 [Armillaria ostoyae]
MSIITDLLSQYNMSNAMPSKVLLHCKLHELPTPPPNALPDITDTDITPT